MIRRTITIELESGLEARPVAMLVQVASQYDSSIYVECDSRRVNAKSIMGMMTLGLTAGGERCGRDREVSDSGMISPRSIRSRNKEHGTGRAGASKRRRCPAWFL